MSSPIEEIRVQCPACAVEYSDWWRPSVNVGLEGWDPRDPEVVAYLRACSTATCPSCGVVVELNTLVVDGNVWRST